MKIEVLDKLNETIARDFPYIEQINIETDNMSFADVPLQRLIMLDRYSLKDFHLDTLTEGDTVVVTIKEDPRWPQRGYGEVAFVGDQYVHVTLDPFFGGETIRRNKNLVDKPLELSIQQIAKRIARGVCEAERAVVRHTVHEELTHVLQNLDLIPAGRIWFGAGNIAQVTWLNCFVIDSPKDSRRGIADHCGDHMDIMATGGGVGSNMSTLRPKNSRVNSVNGRSSGCVSWTDYIAKLTHLIEQGGSRRGAQMKCLNDTHPEIILFAMCKIQKADRLRAIASRFKAYPEIAETALSLISQKDPSRVIDPDFLTGANISVCVSHEFMHAVENKLDWTFKFPDVSGYTPEEKKIYDDEWHLTGGDVRLWEARGFRLKEYGTFPATVLYDLFMYAAWASAEPGFLFYDNARDMANSAYYAPVIATNPCAEQWLPANGTCCLSAVNFANMYNEHIHDIDWDRLQRAIEAGVRFLDNVLDVTPYPLPKIKEMCQGERRIGLGYMGLADLFILLQLPYGTPVMLDKLAQLMEFFRDHSYLASIELAKEKGSFTYFVVDKYLEMGFVKTLPEHIREAIRLYGIRNVCINTVAPTGTTGSMIGVSTGLEPYFAFEYYRSGRMGEFIPVKVKIAQDWLNDHPSETQLPAWFVTAQDIDVYAHASVQAVVQRYIDSATSKTCNAPNSMTVQNTADLYLAAYKAGLKGVTIYRDGSRDEAVLTTNAFITEDTNDADEVFEAAQNAVQYAAERSLELELPVWVHSHVEIAPTVEMFDEFALESTKVCHITYENGQRIVSCGTE